MKVFHIEHFWGERWDRLVGMTYINGAFRVKMTPEGAGYNFTGDGYTAIGKGMLRRRHPKGTDFKRVSKKKLRETTDWINNYPRKIFGFHTAAELFAAAFPGLPALY